MRIVRTAKPSAAVYRCSRPATWGITSALPKPRLASIDCAVGFLPVLACSLLLLTLESMIHHIPIGNLLALGIHRFLFWSCWLALSISITHYPFLHLNSLHYLPRYEVLIIPPNGWKYYYSLKLPPFILFCQKMHRRIRQTTAGRPTNSTNRQANKPTSQPTNPVGQVLLAHH